MRLWAVALAAGAVLRLGKRRGRRGDSLHLFPAPQRRGGKMIYYLIKMFANAELRFQKFYISLMTG